jgi:hypothetical protein
MDMGQLKELGAGALQKQTPTKIKDSLRQFASIFHCENSFSLTGLRASSRNIRKVIESEPFVGGSEPI